MENLDSFFNQYHDFDIRVNHDARYVDQKCTPDIVCFIADCILNTSCANKEFSINDLWNENFFIENCRVIFGKPSPKELSAQNEYNKVLSQPLKLLASAHVLSVSKEGKELLFSINNLDILNFISIRERNAYQFLLAFFNHVIDDSGIRRFFDEYKNSCTANANNAKAAKETIYQKYHRFIASNTPSKSELDCRRMFHKVFNVFAYSEQLPGSNDKHLSFSDLLYNKINWRDSNKDKDVTRADSQKTSLKKINESFFIQYQVDKAIRLVKKIQGNKSEVNDELAAGIATEVHHIFPKSKYPQIASYLENLILLTSSQHRQKAHNNNFSLIDKEYQLICLIAKSQSIEKQLNHNLEGPYSKESFAYVINEGLKQNIISANDSIKTIQKILFDYYNHYDYYMAADKNVTYT